MSLTPITTASSSNFRTIFIAALKAYEKNTKTDLLTHPLATQLQSCNSSSDVLAVLRDRVNEFDQSRSHDERLSSWLNPTINVLYAFTATLGEGVGLIFSPAKVISAGVGGPPLEALADLFERIENFFKRLESYTEVPPTNAMTDMTVKIMVEVLNIFAIATKEMKQGRAKKFLKKLVGRKDIEDALKRLDRLTQEEARMASAQILRLAHSVDGKVKVVDDKVTGVGNQMKDVDDKMKDMDNKMDIVLNDAMDAKAVLQQTSSRVDDVKWNQLRESLRRWVTPPDPSTNHNIACDIHHGGTAEWFYQGSTFAEWKSTGSLLWIYGKPGSGKSILCSTIIRDIASLRKAESALMVYFYFDFRDLDKQHRRNLLPSLLIQLSAQSRSCCDILSHLYSAHDNGEQKPSDSVMIRCLKNMLAILHPQPVYIILDALDECSNWPGIPSPREQVLALVKDLVDLDLPHLHICVTSRPEFDIRATLTPLAHHRVSLHDESGQKKDIVDYVNSVVYSDSETMMKRWREDEKKMVVEALSEKADGMFRWVFCQLDTLRQCLPSSVRQTLDELPESLDETYERIVMDIKKANSAHAYRMLQCLAVAIRPLSVAELAELLAFDFNAMKGGIPELNSNWRWKDHEQAGTFNMLKSNYYRPHLRIPGCPVFALLGEGVLDVGSPRHVDERPFSDTVDENGAATPLARYAAEHWVTHAQAGNVVSRIRDGMEYLFDPDRPYFSAWLKLYNIDNRPWVSELDSKIQPRAVPLYNAAFCGFHGIAEHLALKYPQYANAIGGRAGTALHSASAPGAAWMWILAASGTGRRYCLRHANFQDRRHSTPLSDAAMRGHLKIVQVLLDHNADVNSQDNNGSTPMHKACSYLDSKGDYPQIVRLLLEHGANPNARDNKRRTPSHVVSLSGLVSSLRLEVAHILLAHGADVGAEDEEGMTPSQVASTYGDDKLARLLSVETLAQYRVKGTSTVVSCAVTVTPKKAHA
ncbi:hypothetical protein EDB85DRAFT_1894446 [Lactarius pseudohatsudake]|nr:hypothetical protein EDB85DRAFT_1894446 [Lactarius pseudohatsudake]